MIHWLPVYLCAQQLFLYVKQRLYYETFLLEPVKVGKGGTDVAGAHDYGVVRVGYSEYGLYFGKQRVYVIAVALLAKSAEAIEILPYLRSVKAHHLGQTPG